MPIALVALWATGALADPGNGDLADHTHMMGWGGWALGPLMTVVFLVLIAGAVVLVMRLLGGNASSREDGPADRSLQILRERFAKGEIDAEEFETRKSALGE